MLIAAVRDGATPEIPATTLREAKALLTRLEQNPRVQGDRPDKPEKGGVGLLNKLVHGSKGLA